MATRAYRLRLRSPLHVGDQGIGSEVTHAYVPSDTLFSAVAVTWRTLPGLARTLDALLNEQKPPLLLSSAFPYAGDVLLLPKPALPFTPDAKPNASGKQFRRVRWVSHSVFVQLLANPTRDTLNALWQAGKTLQAGAAWVSADELATIQTHLGSEDPDLYLWRTGIVPRVTVDRVSSAGQIHHTGRASFAPGCGLWCMAQAEPDWLAALEQALAVLGDAGLGGKRSSGNGQFDFELMPTPPLPAAASDYVVLLSRVAPTRDQMPLLRRPEAAYDLVLVGGFNGTPGDGPLVRRQVRMLAEGSIVGAPDPGATLGSLVDVTPTDAPLPGHRIWRSGLAFAVPVLLPAAPGESTP